MNESIAMKWLLTVAVVGLGCGGLFTLVGLPLSKPLLLIGLVSWLAIIVWFVWDEGL